MDSEIDWKSRIRTAFGSEGSAPEDDVLEELAGHAQTMYEAALAEGCAPDEADGRVARQIEYWRVNAHELRRFSRHKPAVQPPSVFSSVFSGLAQDFLYAIRLLRRDPRFAVLSILTMALAVGATTVLFNVSYGVLMRPLPWPNGHRLVALKETRGGHSPRFLSFTNTTYVAWRDRMTSIEDIAAWSQGDATLAGAGDPDRIRVVRATASLFRVLGVHAILGSTFFEDDEAKPVLVLSHSLWRERFNASRQAIGRVVRLDGQPYTIIGVLSDDVSFPDKRAQAWAPMSVRQSAGDSLSMFNAIASTRAGAGSAEVAAEGTARGSSAVDTPMTDMAIFGSAGRVQVSAEFLNDALTSDVRRPLVVLLAAVVLMFLAATANVAGLQLARATTRRREIVIRAALGAGNARIGRQLLLENLLVGFTGGGAGLCLAWQLHRIIPALLSPDFPRLGELRMDAMVVVVALLAAFTASVLCGMLPGLYVRRLRLTESLSEEGSTVVGSGKRSRTIQGRMVIMAAQVSVACILLIGASLLGRSFLALLNVDRGYDPSAVLTANVRMPWQYRTERLYAIVDDILSRLSTAPGVIHASFTSEMPLTPGGSTGAFTMKAPHSATGVMRIQASPRLVSPQYFSAMRMRIIKGRAFTDSDTQASQPVAIVNRSFAQRYLGGDALGVTLPMGAYGDGRVDATIVGVVDDVRYVTLSEPTQPEIYYSYLQIPRNVWWTPVINLVVRTAGNPEDSVTILRTAVRETDGGLVPDSVATMEDRMLRHLTRPRLYAILLGGFALFSTMVAGVGLFGVLSYLVAQRSRELALRMAVGARQIDIVRQVLGQGIGITATGLCVGMFGAIVLMRSLAAMLYGVTSHDAFTFVTVPIVLLLIAAIACIAPALRASRIDPIRLLKG